MEIDNNNYEEYFLLYADKELSESERKEVEVFVQQHPELKEEFEMILMTINVPEEEVSLADKSFLKKNQQKCLIDKNNYEEIFVLYHDNELTFEEKKEVEAFLRNFPEYFSAFEIIGKAKLTAEIEIFFPQKQSLYRKEKDRKIAPLYILKYVAAASFAGFAIWFSVSYFNQSANERSVAIKTTLPADAVSNNSNAATMDIGPKELKKDDDSEARQNSVNYVKNDLTSGSVAKKNAVKNKATLNTKNTRSMERFIPIKNNAQKEMIASKALINDIPEPLARKDNSTNSQDVAKNSEPVSINDIDAIKVQHASYAINNEDNNDNYVFYNVTTEEFNKTKVGGFLKKVKRIVERSNPIAELLSGDSKQVAAK